MVEIVEIVERVEKVKDFFTQLPTPNIQLNAPNSFV